MSDFVIDYFLLLIILVMHLFWIEEKSVIGICAFV